MSPPPDAPPPSRRWRILLLLSVAELLGMSLWFTASAVAPQLQALWGLDAQQAGWLTTSVQLGFVAGTAAAALLNLADVVPARPYFAVSALCAALANALLVLAPGYAAALGLRFLTGFFLAGVYPPAMKMIATWFQSGRGLAIGTLVGALTLGKATPYLLRAAEGASLNAVVLAASCGAAAAGLLVALGYREGPFPFARRPFSWRLVGTVAGHRPTRLAIGGYLGHMWELYAMWGFVAVFFADFFLARGASDARAGALSGAVAFAVIGMGGVGSVLAGAWADRLGRERVTIWAMGVSGACALLIGWMLQAPFALVLTVALIWGFAVVADSAQFSAMVTEVAPSHAVGTALTLQTSLGFLLTTVTIQGVPALREAVGWPLAFGVLALGPALGIAAMRRLENVRIREAKGQP
ncbi:MAG TPA: MFS transporter [Longimicrobiaceae bacterium]|nr:MFS transporter [Longimicrobiaceae bacterium]